MVDVARLGLAIDSSQVEKGTVSLHQLTGAAGQASAAAQRLAGATTAEAAGHKAAAAAAQVHNAALMAQNTVIRSSMQQRTMMIYQLNDVGVSLASGMNPMMVAIQQGSQILQGGLGPALRTITDLTVGLVAKFWPLAAVVGVISAGIAGLTSEINETAAVQVGFFDVALAGWQLFAETIASLVAPVFGQLGAWIAQGWDIAAPILKDIGNTIIGTFAFAIKAVGALWNGLPAAVGDAVITTANVIIKGVEWSINGATRLLNGFLSKYNEGLASMGQKTIPLASGISIPQAANPYQGALGKLGTDIGGAGADAFSTDYMGEMGGALSKRAQEIAAARKETEGLGGAAAAANDNVKKLADDGLSAAAKSAQSFGDNIKSAFKGFVSDIREGKSWVEALGNALGGLGDKLLDLAIDTVFGSFGGGGKDGGGGGIFGWLGSLFGFADGGVFNAGHQVQAFAKGGVVSKPTMFPMANGAGLMGEAGPEAIMPLRRGADGRLGVSAANQNQAQSVRVSVDVGVSVDDEGKIQTYVKSVSQQEAQAAAGVAAQAAISQSAKQTPGVMAKYNQARAGSDYRT